MLHVVLALDRKLDILVLFEVDQPFQSVSFREAWNRSRSMFMHASDEIVCHANVKRAIRTVRQYINPADLHAAIFKNVDGRDKPGHDGGV